MDDKNKNAVTEDKCLDLDQLENISGGMGLHDVEVNETTPISDNTMEKIWIYFSVLTVLLNSC